MPNFVGPGSSTSVRVCIVGGVGYFQFSAGTIDFPTSLKVLRNGHVSDAWITPLQRRFALNTGNQGLWVGMPMLTAPINVQVKNHPLLVRLLSISSTIRVCSNKTHRSMQRIRRAWRSKRVENKQKAEKEKERKLWTSMLAIGGLPYSLVWTVLESCSIWLVFEEFLKPPASKQPGCFLAKYLTYISKKMGIWPRPIVWPRSIHCETQWWARCLQAQQSQRNWTHLFVGEQCKLQGSTWNYLDVIFPFKGKCCFLWLPWFSTLGSSGHCLFDG